LLVLLFVIPQGSAVAVAFAVAFAVALVVLYSSLGHQRHVARRYVFDAVVCTHPVKSGSDSGGEYSRLGCA
jgi:Mg2+/citrate symporter